MYVYYFGARFFQDAIARFYQPDFNEYSSHPSPVPYAKLNDPQSLNLYTYVLDNPLSLRDADGHEFWNTPEEPGSPFYDEEVQQQAAVATDQKVAQQQTDSQPVGSTTVGSLEKTMTHEDGSLSTPKGGDPSVLEAGKAALANAIINGAEAPHPPLVATPTVPASGQDAQIMRDAYTNRANGGADPVQGRTFYGTSHTPPDRLHSRPIGNGRQTVFQHFGPFKDSISRQQTYIYIYNNP